MTLWLDTVSLIVLVAVLLMALDGFTASLAYERSVSIFSYIAIFIPGPTLIAAIACTWVLRQTHASSPKASAL